MSQIEWRKRGARQHHRGGFISGIGQRIKTVITNVIDKVEGVTPPATTTAPTTAVPSAVITPSPIRGLVPGSDSETAAILAEEQAAIAADQEQVELPPVEDATVEDEVDPNELLGEDNPRVTHFPGIGTSIGHTDDLSRKDFQ
jgi:hypothetical protein